MERPPASMRGWGVADGRVVTGPRRPGLSKAFQAADLGLRFVIITLLGAAAGFWLDRKLDIAPALTVVGLFVGLGLALVGLMSGLKSNNRGGPSGGDAR